MMRSRAHAMTWLVAAIGALVVAAPEGRAVSLVVSNHSFEVPAVAPGNFSTAAAPPGWAAFGNVDFGWRTVGVVNPNSTLLYLDPVPLGSNIGVVFLGPSFSNSPAGLRQTLSTTLQARTTYTLTVAIGNMGNDPNPPHNSFNFSGFPGYRVELLAGGSLVAADHNSLLPGEGRFLTSVVHAAISSAHTNLGLPLGIRLINLDAASGIEVNFDDVRLEASPMPDPVVSIAWEPSGGLQLVFTEVLQASTDLLSWSNVTPQPVSPWTPTASNAHRFFRASE